MFWVPRSKFRFADGSLHKTGTWNREPRTRNLEPGTQTGFLPLLYCSNFDGRLVATTAIPNRAVFRSQEVCEIAEVQAYVLRSWEAEFPDLGMSKSADGPRVYRRADVERVLRLKHLLFVEGLTLAGARKQMVLEGATAPEASGLPLPPCDSEVR